MTILRRLLLALLACFAWPAPPARSRCRSTSAGNCSALVAQVRDPGGVPSCRPCWRNCPRTPTWRTLQVLGTQALQIMRTGTTTSDARRPRPPLRPARARPSVLVLYDAPVGTEFDKLGFGYAIMLRNLLGHFDAQGRPAAGAATTRPARSRPTSATFYLGASYDNPIPPAFLADVATTAKPVVWFKYNLWQLAWNPARTTSRPTNGITLNGLRGMNAMPSAANAQPRLLRHREVQGPGLRQVLRLRRGAQHHQRRPGHRLDHDRGRDQGAAGSCHLNDGQPSPPATSCARATSGTWPTCRSASSARVTATWCSPTCCTTSWASTTPRATRPWCGFEDVGALVSVQAMKTLSDYMFAKRIPYSIATIPLYMDPLGAVQRRRAGDGAAVAGDQPAALARLRAAAAAPRS